MDAMHRQVPDVCSYCSYQMYLVESAKIQWALENKLQNDAVATWKDLQPYLPNGRPCCPEGGHYFLGNITNGPMCSIKGHKVF